MINPNFYQQLPIEDKIEILTNNGDFIEAHEGDEYDTWLYALEGEYVELFYNVTKCRVEEVNLLEDKCRLELYIDNIDISPLLVA
ncbi:MAG: hypothetical protein M3R27_02905 [Bacteroidota bacterium]|nr:hypothetical protein [Bacteroidota bacterium]